MKDTEGNSDNFAEQFVVGSVGTFAGNIRDGGSGRSH